MSAKDADDEHIEIIDPAFRQVLRSGSSVRRIADERQFTEGPIWYPRERCLLFSDIPADTIYRWSEGKGLSVWRKPSHNANGHAVDLRGRIVSCEHGSRTLTRTEPATGTAAGGKVACLAATYKGRKLNSPNDVVVKSDGSIWFTDPPYGIRPAQQEQPKNYVFRLDPGAAEPVAVASDFSRPNGLCFSPDEKRLYIADSDAKRHHVRVFAVGARNTLGKSKVFASIRPGSPDGMRVDADGRLYSTAGDGVHVFSPAGRLLGKIRTPKAASNCTFGASDFRTLFITARDSVWALDLAVAGARPAPAETKPKP